jgi:hypothetical protein
MIEEAEEAGKERKEKDRLASLGCGAVLSARRTWLGVRVPHAGLRTKSLKNDH